MNHSIEAIEVWVSGRVQGVWFRAFTEKSATAIGVSGYVENLPDGRVHLHAQGTEDQLKQLLEQLKKGPRGSRVEGLESIPVNTRPESGFTTRH